MKKVFAPAYLLCLPIAALTQQIDLSSRIERLKSAASAAQSNADNSWMLTCSALVLLMAIPGLALFYGSPVNQKNVLSTALQSWTFRRTEKLPILLLRQKFFLKVPKKNLKIHPLR